MNKMIKAFIALMLCLALTSTPVFAVSVENYGAPTAIEKTDADLSPYRAFFRDIHKETEAALCLAFYNHHNVGGSLDGKYTVEDCKVAMFLDNYNGYDAAVFESEFVVYTEAERVETVAGYDIYFPDGRGVWLHKDGKLYTLSEAYTNGYVTKEDVFSIGLKFGVTDEGGNENDILKDSIGDVNGDYKVDNLDAALILQYDCGKVNSLNNRYRLPYMPQDVKDEISLAYYDYWCSKLPSIKDESTVDEFYVIAYYGTYSGCDFVYLADPLVDSYLYLTVTVAGYSMQYGSDRQVIVHKDGDFYSTQEAYDKGLVTKEDIYNLGLYKGVVVGVDINEGEMLYKRTGDVNGDFVVNNIDAALILKYDAGL